MTKNKLKRLESEILSKRNAATLTELKNLQTEKAKHNQPFNAAYVHRSLQIAGGPIVAEPASQKTTNSNVIRKIIGNIIYRVIPTILFIMLILWLTPIWHLIFHFFIIPMLIFWYLWAWIPALIILRKIRPWFWRD